METNWDKLSIHLEKYSQASSICLWFHLSHSERKHVSDRLCWQPCLCSSVVFSLLSLFLWHGRKTRCCNTSHFVGFLRLPLLVTCIAVTYRMARCQGWNKLVVGGFLRWRWAALRLRRRKGAGMRSPGFITNAPSNRAACGTAHTA